jgi:lysophospholipase L1-like esterase
MLRVFLPAILLAAGSVSAADPFPLKDGDVVALIGNTFIEREQRDGFIELALTLAYPEANVIFRNLGWSGDTVDGRARRFFGPTEEGMKHLLDHLDAVKPTVILVCYGTNEAFDGEGGRSAFIEGYGKLLDELSKRTDRILLITAPPLDPSASVAPDVAKRVNEELKSQSAAVYELAKRRGFSVADLYARLAQKLEGEDRLRRLTDNGLHYTPFGYRVAGRMLLNEVNSSSLTGVREGYDTRDDMQRSLAEPYEKLRLAIVEKNTLFFHRHRPQNETYLRGFRKHEQGNNAAEIYAFEPLVAQKDQEIFALRKAALETPKSQPRAPFGTGRD